MISLRFGEHTTSIQGMCTFYIVWIEKHKISMEAEETVMVLKRSDEVIRNRCTTSRFNKERGTSTSKPKRRSRLSQERTHRGQRLAVDERGNVLAWTGDLALAVAPAAAPVSAQAPAPLTYTPPHLTDKSWRPSPPWKANASRSRCCLPTSRTRPS